MTDAAADLVESKVHNMPDCDFKDQDFETCDDLEDRYDFKTKQGPWANGCTRHWQRHRLYLSLGVGKGQKLIKA